jgi:hypothetical protein
MRFPAGASKLHASSVQRPRPDAGGARGTLTVVSVESECRFDNLNLECSMECNQWDYVGCPAVYRIITGHVS